jgi:hypothetical protein
MSNPFLQEPTATESVHVDAVLGQPTDARPALASSLTPPSCESVMLVVDQDGYFIPLYTAGDLLRWCKAVWRAERD